MLKMMTMTNHWRNCRIEMSAPANIAAKIMIALIAPWSMPNPMTSSPVTMQTIAVTT